MEIKRQGDFSGIPQKSRLDTKPKSGVETHELRRILSFLIKEHGKTVVMKHIEKNVVGATSSVVDDWLNRGIVPDLEIQQGIISTVENFSKVENNLPTVNGAAIHAPEQKPVEAPAVNSDIISTPEQEVVETPLLKKPSLQSKIQPTEGQRRIMRQRAEEGKKKELNTRAQKKQDVEQTIRDKEAQMRALVEKFKQEGKVSKDYEM